MNFSPAMYDGGEDDLDFDPQIDAAMFEGGGDEDAMSDSETIGSMTGGADEEECAVMEGGAGFLPGSSATAATPAASKVVEQGTEPQPENNPEEQSKLAKVIKELDINEEQKKEFQTKLKQIATKYGLENDDLDNNDYDNILAHILELVLKAQKKGISKLAKVIKELDINEEQKKEFQTKLKQIATKYGLENDDLDNNDYDNILAHILELVLKAQKNGINLLKEKGVNNAVKNKRFVMILSILSDVMIYFLKLLEVIKLDINENVKANIQTFKTNLQSLKMEQVQTLQQGFEQVMKPVDNPVDKPVAKPVTDLLSGIDNRQAAGGDFISDKAFKKHIGKFKLVIKNPALSDYEKMKEIFIRQASESGTNILDIGKKDETQMKNEKDEAEYQRLMKIVKRERGNKQYEEEITTLQINGRVNKGTSEQILKTMDEGNDQPYNEISDVDLKKLSDDDRKKMNIKKMNIATLFAIAVLKPNNYGRNKYIEMLIKYYKSGDDNDMLKESYVKTLFPKPTQRTSIFALKKGEGEKTSSDTGESHNLLVNKAQGQTSS